MLIDRFLDGEKAGYPTLCKGRFAVGDETYHALEEPVSLSTLDLLPKLQAMGIAAVKIEGRQRSPAYVAQVTQVWRQAIDKARTSAADPAQLQRWAGQLSQLSEGSLTTLGAYHRKWK